MCREANSKSGGKFRNQGTFIRLGRNQPSGGTGSPHIDISTQRMNGVGMSRSQLVAEHLPFLRRYARALTGNQASGDAYVGATLEALVEDPTVIDDTGGPRVALYRLLTKLWGSVGLNTRQAPVADDIPA